MLPDGSLKAGAQARLTQVRQQLAEVRREIVEHERACADLRERLPELEFEESAMQYILAGPAPEGAVVAPGRKLSRTELIHELKRLMAGRKAPWEVGELHALLEAEGIDLGANARNYLCGVLSRNKEVHFANLGKGCWGLAGSSRST